MKALISKRKSIAAAGSAKSPARKPAQASAKAKPVSKSPKKPLAAPPKPPRLEFLGRDESRIYLMCGEPLELSLPRIVKAIPLSVHFPGAHLSVVHTPANWSPKELFDMTKKIKILNRSAGLDSFVVLLGTGLTNVHMNMEAIMKHTQHVQFVVFHREDANKAAAPNGKLRETNSFFLAGYFFPGCEDENSALPTKLVMDGYTTNFRTDSIEKLEYSIIDCFSEKGEWVMDISCGKRKLTLAAAERGRNAIALDSSSEDLENLGDYIRTLSMQQDEDYREEDGLVSSV